VACPKPIGLVKNITKLSILNITSVITNLTATKSD
jgi:hypothetical protein